MIKTTSSLPAQLRHSYFALATFNLLIVVTILFSHQHYLHKFSGLVDANQQKTKLITELSALSELIVLASAPGNDIFENGDLDEAERRFHLHRNQIKVSLNAVKGQITSDYVRQSDFLSQLDRLASEVDSAEAATLNLFTLFRNNPKNPPGAQMAVADRAFARAFRSLTSLELAIAESQQISIAAHQNALLSNQQKEILFSVFGLVALGGLILYGRTLTQHLSRQSKIETEYLENTNRMIADLREVNAQLAKREAYIQSLFHQSRDPIMTLAPPTWSFTTGNPATLKLFAVENESEFVKLGPWSVSPERQPDGRLSSEAAQFAIQKAMTDGSYFFDWMHCKLDGTLIPCTVLLSKVAFGESVFLQATVRDVTAEREKQSELSQVMRAIEQSAIVSIISFEGKILSVNSSFCEITGYTKEELLGRELRTIYSDVEAQTKFAELWSTINNGRTWSGEIKSRKKNDQVYTIKSVVAPVYSLDCKVDRFISISFDLSEQKHLQYQLEEAQAVAQIGNWSFDFQLKKIEWSKQMYKLFPEDIEKGPPDYERHLSTIHPDDRAHWIATVNQCAKDGEPYRMRFRSVFPDKTLWIEALGHGVFDQSGRVLSLSGTYQDITAKVAAEDSLEEERLKAIHAAKLASLGEMAAGVAHEINNPLAIIAGTTGLLRKFKNDPEKLVQKSETIDKAVARISKIVRGLSKFSRSSEPTEMSQHKLLDLLNDALVITEAKAKRHSVTLERDFTTDGLITCDGMEIEQVIINLVNNAVDACKDRPAKWVKVVLSRSEFEVVLQVHDSGPGVPPEIEAKLFQPFFTTKPIGEGTGLGLSICKGILDHHQAQISINRSFSHTCFEVRFRAIS